MSKTIEEIETELRGTVAAGIAASRNQPDADEEFVNLQLAAAEITIQAVLFVKRGELSGARPENVFAALGAALGTSTANAARFTPSPEELLIFEKYFGNAMMAVANQEAPEDAVMVNSKGVM